MIHTGQIVTFKVDAFPKDSFTGRVSQVRLNATTVQNVVTYNTIIDFDNPDLKLFPGMTAYITIPVADAPNALRVPNGALRYKPDMSADQIPGALQTIWIDLGQSKPERKRPPPRDPETPGLRASNGARMLKAPKAAGRARTPRSKLALHEWTLP